MHRMRAKYLTKTKQKKSSLTISQRRRTTAVFGFKVPHPFCFLIPWHPPMDEYGTTSSSELKALTQQLHV